MIRPKIETEDLLLSITKNCETLVKETHRKAEEALEFSLSQPREPFYYNPLKSIERSWMLGLTNFEVYTSISSINRDDNKFELIQIVSMSFHSEN